MQELLEKNQEQIETARNFKILLDVEQNFFDKIKRDGRAMVYFCSDGRYTNDILNYLWFRTENAQLHIFADHGGALNLARNCSLHAPDSTLKRDRMKQIGAAHESMGYKILINICHGPECKGMMSLNLDINSAFDRYQTVTDEILKSVPGVEVYNLFHRDKGGSLLRLYEYSADNWLDLRRRFPEPIWLTEEAGA